MQLRLRNSLSPLLDAGYLEEAMRRHFEPLFEATFDEVLRRHYAGGVQFEVDGQRLAHVRGQGRRRTRIPIRMGRRRIPSAVASLERHDALLADDRSGHRDQHVRQGDQARLGLARSHTGHAWAGQRRDRSARARRRASHSARTTSFAPDRAARPISRIAEPYRRSWRDS